MLFQASPHLAIYADANSTSFPECLIEPRSQPNLLLLPPSLCQLFFMPSFITWPKSWPSLTTFFLTLFFQTFRNSFWLYLQNESTIRPLLTTCLIPPCSKPLFSSAVSVFRTTDVSLVSLVCSRFPSSLRV